MKFLLDTDVLVDLFNDQQYAKQLMPALVFKGSFYISTITIAELRAGFTHEQADFFLPKLYDFAAVLDLNRKMAELGGQFRFDYGKKGKILSITDALIAATAILQNCQLVTRNKKDYPMPEIKFYQIYVIKNVR